MMQLRLRSNFGLTLLFASSLVRADVPPPNINRPWSGSSASGSAEVAPRRVGVGISVGSTTAPSVRSQLTIDAVQVTSNAASVNAQSVRRVLLMNHGQVRSCHERSLASNPSLVGALSVRFSLLGTGRVSSCAVETTPDAALGTCVCNWISRMVFLPTTDGAPAQLSTSLTLNVVNTRAAPRAGCGHIDREGMPANVAAIAERLLERRCLGTRGSIVFRRGVFEVWYDGEATAPSVFINTAGGVEALRGAGIRSVRVHVTGGASGEFDVLPTRSQAIQ